MTRIFISYSRVDREFVEQFAKTIGRKYGHDNIWFDDKLQGGVQWWDEILRQINLADIFIYLLSKDSTESKYCIAESEEAVRLQKSLLPVLIRDRTPLSGTLTELQYIDLKPGANLVEGYTRLYTAIDEFEKQRPPHPPKPLSDRPVPRPGSTSVSEQDFPGRSDRKMSIYICNKHGDQNAASFQANVIFDYLSKFPEEFVLAMDSPATKQWEDHVYNSVMRSDVVLLPITPKTIESRWVARELELAQQAQICIIPVLVQGSKEELYQVLEHFNLTQLDYLELFTGNDGELISLKQAIDSKRGTTRENQLLWLTALLRQGSQMSVQKRPAIPEKSRHIYKLPFHPCEIHLASGDMTKLQDIDVIINPENNYLQMARIFEATSISSKLRLMGSKRNRSGHPIEDTVQIDLNDLTRFDEYRIPIAGGQVIPTHAGHPESELVTELNVRYLFHVVSVMVHHTADRQDQIRPIDNSTIHEAIQNCLEKVIEVDEAKGVFAPNGSAQRNQQITGKSSYQPIESILFPLLTTGHGTRQSQDEIKQVAWVITEAVYNYLKTNSNAGKLQLKRIHICGYSEADVQIIKNEMGTLLQ